MSAFNGSFLGVLSTARTNFSSEAGSVKDRFPPKKRASQLMFALPCRRGP
jgi:hypothetical protein